jgi:hypothetical protein
MRLTICLWTAMSTSAPIHGLYASIAHLALPVSKPESAMAPPAMTGRAFYVFSVHAYSSQRTSSTRAFSSPVANLRKSACR